MSSGATNPIGSQRQSSGASSRSNHNGKPTGTTNHQAVADLLHSKLRARRKTPTQQRTATEPVPFYHQQTHRPIVCLAFVLPIVMLYEISSILLANDAVRTGIDQWIGGIFGSMGVGEVVILPVVVTAILVVWHHRRHDRWSFNPLILAGMFLESSLLGLILYWSANAVYFLATVSHPDPVLAIAATDSDWLVACVSVLGSGIYEETFFRILLLLPLIAWATWLTDSREIGVVAGMVLCSLVFALVHYSLFNPAGHAFEVSSFLFRFGASIVFCNLFLFRGFGIAVGSHVIYDVLTQL